MSRSSVMAFASYFVALLAFFPLTATSTAAQEDDPVPQNVPREVTLDLNGDGKPDRAVIVETAEDGSGDLLIYFGAGDGKLDPGRKADFVKKDLLEGGLMAFEKRGKDSLILRQCTGCTSLVWIDETLTIAYRNGALVIGGFDQGWEVTKRRFDLNVDVEMGDCSINFLTGKARVAKGLEPDQPVAQRFKPARLADWSDETIPKICYGH